MVHGLTAQTNATREGRDRLAVTRTVPNGHRRLPGEHGRTLGVEGSRWVRFPGYVERTRGVRVGATPTGAAALDCSPPCVHCSTVDSVQDEAGDDRYLRFESQPAPRSVLALACVSNLLEEKMLSP